MINKEEAVKEHINLVKKYANQFKTKYCYDDLLQEGLIALCLAVDKFDDSKDVKFSTFASSYIINTLKRFLNINKRTIRLPLNKVKVLNDYFSLHKKIKNEEENEDCAIKDIAKMLKIKESELLELIHAEKGCLSLDKTYEIEDFCNNENNLYKYIYAKEDKQYKEIEQSIETDCLVAEIKSILNCLMEEERKLIIDRYGLFSDEGMKSKVELATKYGKSRKNISYSICKAMKKMRNNKNIDCLRQYI